MHTLLWSAGIGMFLFLQSCYQPTQFELPIIVIDNPFINTQEIKNFIGTENAKITLTLRSSGRRRVFWSDFNDTVPQLYEIEAPSGKEDWDMDSPLISPDGQWITYYMINQNNCAAYFQRLDTTSAPVLLSGEGADPHWWIDDTTADMYIIYANTFFVQKGSFEAIQGATLKQKVELSGNGRLIGSPVQLADKPFTGGLSLDGNYLGTGYEDAAIFNLRENRLDLLNRNMQTCNPSISQDPAHPNWLLFLNIQGEQNIAGDTLGFVLQHEIIYIVDNANTLQWYIRTPSDITQWQDPEWSNNAGIITALGSMQMGALERWDLYLLKIRDKSILRINNVNSNFFNLNSTSTPYIWIGE